MSKSAEQTQFEALELGAALNGCRASVHGMCWLVKTSLLKEEKYDQIIAGKLLNTVKNSNRFRGTRETDRFFCICS